MSKQALKRVRKEIGIPVCREPLPSFAWPGGYPIVYLFRDGGSLCPDCANRHIDEIDADIRGGRVWNSHGGWALSACDTHMEGEPEVCDHCGKEIESAYGPIDAQ
jgi:hypothetical protein